MGEGGKTALHERCGEGLRVKRPQAALARTGNAFGSLRTPQSAQAKGVWKAFSGQKPVPYWW